MLNRISLIELVQVELCPQKELLRTTGAGFYRLDVLPVAQPTRGYLLNVFSVLILLVGCYKGNVLICGNVLIYLAKKHRRVLEILCGMFQRCSRVRL